MNKEKLVKFEEEIAELFNSGKIKAPVHLYHGNEDQIINVFKKIRSDDWVFLQLEISLSMFTKRSARKTIKGRNTCW